MFFPDPTQAIREMGRVCRPGGVVGIQVYSSLAEQPAYGPWVAMVARYAGQKAIDLLSTYWVHGDLEVLTRRLAAAGLDAVSVRTRVGTARFASVDELVLTEIASTPLIDRITDEIQRRILADSHQVLGKFRTDSGLEAPLAGHLVIAHKKCRNPVARQGCGKVQCGWWTAQYRADDVATGSTPTVCARVCPEWMLRTL